MHSCCRRHTVLALAAFLIAVLAAQTLALEGELKVVGENEKQMLTLRDGSTLIGRTTFVGDDEITFQTEMGEMTVAIDRIKEIRTLKASEMRGGEYWFPNPNQTRMLFGPTGRMLKKGEGYFFDVLLFFPGAAYAITDNITIGGGMSIFPGLDAEEQIYFITPKIGLNVLDKVDVAANLMLVRVPVDNEDVEDANSLLPPEERVEVEVAETVGLLFLTGTYGSENSHLTFGLGFGVEDSDLSDKPAITIGGEHRLARRISLVSENWIFPGLDDPIASGGVRFFGENIAVDLALLGLFDEDIPALPYIDFVYNF